ncbi:hypothetical protein 2 [Hubei myriapoda virus 3]|uniref:hypothetical protein 2 n=1 Tax=Hubei myriapoda virus 3 TaxID=1922932 RepID=UPI000909B680|nr:hypothetical protein 2 [Hubei myriapoda virus 3]APG77510.1 hypothetical protein 2 [Hubei myriapoda virus 3]
MSKETKAEAVPENNPSLAFTNEDVSLPTSHSAFTEPGTSPSTVARDIGCTGVRVFPELYEKDYQIDSITWDIGKSPGTILKVFTISPDMHPQIAYLMKMFQFWSGTIDIVFKIAGTGFNAGLIGITTANPLVPLETYKNTTDFCNFDTQYADPKQLALFKVTPQDFHIYNTHINSINQTATGDTDADKITKASGLAAKVAVFVSLQLASGTSGNTSVDIGVFLVASKSFRLHQILPAPSSITNNISFELLNHALDVSNPYTKTATLERCRGMMAVPLSLLDKPKRFIANCAGATGWENDRRIWNKTHTYNSINGPIVIENVTYDYPAFLGFYESHPTTVVSIPVNQNDETALSSHVATLDYTDYFEEHPEEKFVGVGFYTKNCIPASLIPRKSVLQNIRTVESQNLDGALGLYAIDNPEEYQNLTSMLPQHPRFDSIRNSFQWGLAMINPTTKHYTNLHSFTTLKNLTCTPPDWELDFSLKGPSSGESFLLFTDTYDYQAADLISIDIGLPSFQTEHLASYMYNKPIQSNQSVLLSMVDTIDDKIVSQAKLYPEGYITVPTVSQLTFYGIDRYKLIAQRVVPRNYEMRPTAVQNLVTNMIAARTQQESQTTYQTKYTNFLLSQHKLLTKKFKTVDKLNKYLDEHSTKWPAEPLPPEQPSAPDS